MSTDTTTPQHRSPARTTDEMTRTMRRYYGVWVAEIGEDGDKLALGHHAPRRVLAAFNRLARQDQGLLNLDDSRNATYQDALKRLRPDHAVLVQECDEHPECGGVRADDEDWCGSCTEIAESAWWVNSGMSPTAPDAFPVTLWRA